MSSPNVGDCTKSKSLACYLIKYAELGLVFNGCDDHNRIIVYEDASSGQMHESSEVYQWRHGNFGKNLSHIMEVYTKHHRVDLRRVGAIRRREVKGAADGIGIKSLMED